jgi:curved DNA-binding protein CbpA
VNRSPFEVLQVDPDADETEVKRAYRRRMKETHPDQGGSAEAFRQVREAYDLIVSGEYDPADSSDAADPPGAGAAADAGAPADADADADADAASVHPTVEYLDYEALGDYAWELDDDDLFAKAGEAGLQAPDYGRFHVMPDESLLEAAEREGFAWPYACRGGACANCAVVVYEGELSTFVDHVLPDEMVERGIQLSCNAVPLTDELRIVYNVKHMPELEELLLPPRPFEQAQADD